MSIGERQFDLLGSTRDHVLYGTKSGRVGLAALRAKGGALLWECATSSGAAVSAIFCHALSGAASPDVIVGKEDGIVEILAEHEASAGASLRQSYVRRRWRACKAKSRRAELRRRHNGARVLSSRRGRRLRRDHHLHLHRLDFRLDYGAAGQPTRRRLRTAASGQSRADAVSVEGMPIHGHASNFRLELEELESKVRDERERHEEAISTYGGDPNAPAVASAPALLADSIAAEQASISDRFVLDKTLACYTLSIERE